MLTDEGLAETEKLIDRSNADIFRIIDSLSADECRELEHAVDTVTRLLLKDREGAKCR